MNKNEDFHSMCFNFLFSNRLNWGCDWYVWKLTFTLMHSHQQAQIKSLKCILLGFNVSSPSSVCWVPLPKIQSLSLQTTGLILYLIISVCELLCVNFRWWGDMPSRLQILYIGFITIFGIFIFVFPSLSGEFAFQFFHV